MAIFSTRFGVIKRSAGQSSVKHVAYILRTTMKDYNTGKTWYNSPTKNGQSVLASGTLLPLNTGAPEEWSDPAVLWNAVEEYNTSSNAQVCSTHMYALPKELTDEQLIALGETIAVNHQCEGRCVTWAIHKNTYEQYIKTGTWNPHLHLALTMNPCDEHGFTSKTKATVYVMHDENGDEIVLTSDEANKHPEYEKLYHYCHTDSDVKYMTVDEAAEEDGEWVSLKRHPKISNQHLYVRVDGDKAVWTDPKSAKSLKSLSHGFDGSDWVRMKAHDDIKGLYLYVHVDGNYQWLTRAEGDETDVDMLQVSYQPKSRKLNATDWNNPANARRWRKDAEMNINDALRWAGHNERVSCLSYEEQGIDKEPTIHEGAAVRRAEAAHREHCKMTGEVYTPIKDKAIYNYEVRYRNKQRERQRLRQTPVQEHKQTQQQKQRERERKAKQAADNRERELQRLSHQRQVRRMEKEAAKALKREFVKAANKEDDVGVEAVFAD